MTAYLYLAGAIVAEVIATSALKASNGFTNMTPSIITIIGYTIAFWCLSIVLKTVPVGVAYAIWSGVGVALITLVGWVVFKQALDLAAFVGIGLIVTGVVVLQLFSKSSAH